MKALLTGDLTIDINITENAKYISPGGSVYFLAKTLESFKVDNIIITHYGEDFPKECLKHSLIYPTKPTHLKTLTFKNIYDRCDRRKQMVENYRAFLRFNLSQLKLFSYQNIDMVVVAPILNNINRNQLKTIVSTFPKSLKVLLTQGFYRQINSDGKIMPCNWNKEDELVELFNIVVVSHHDREGIDKKASEWSKSGTIVAATKGKDGSSVYMDGERIDMPAFSVENIIDPTGAGDIFAAAFSLAFLKSKDIKASAEFANATAAFSLRHKKYQLQYRYQDIIDFGKSYGRKINL